MPAQDAPEERWYETVDIGLHVRDPIGPEAPTQAPEKSPGPDRLTKEDARRWFVDWSSSSSSSPSLSSGGSSNAVSAESSVGPTLSAEGVQHFSAVRGALRFVERADEAPGSRRSFRAQDGPFKVFIRGFSKKHVRVFVLWATGTNRWHHLYDLVADLQVERTDDIDRRLGIASLEAQYGLEACGVRHGMRANDAIEVLKGALLEYPGQSRQFRRLYAPDCDLEIVIQDSVVKYLTRGDPGWLDAALRLRDRRSEP
ncbi:MAG: hypothetical protein H6729_08095 [Deltaproteobacteria bacterium]|nr:hypothetical protein [Deltaproteobacteria bacterium]